MKFIETQPRHHSLLNTLDLVNHNVVCGNRRKATDTLLSLWRSHRICSMNGERSITLTEHRELLSLCVQIIGVQDPERYSVTIVFDSRVANLTVVKYAFQPHIKNAVVRGVSGPTQSVPMRFRENTGVVSFTVENNGPDIPPDKLAKLKALFLPGKKTSGEICALLSIDQRDKLCFTATVPTSRSRAPPGRKSPSADSSVGEEDK